jgi:hypothetical protein
MFVKKDRPKKESVEVKEPPPVPRQPDAVDLAYMTMFGRI